MNPAETTFSLGFIYLNYSYPDSNLYEFKLEGYDKEWRTTNQEFNFATYTNVPSGKYVFKVKASNPVRKIYNNEGLSIPILLQASWYKTTWAYIGYGILFFLVVGSIFFYQRQYYQLVLKNNENEKLREMNVLKERLYANITHEFRTPLTVIQGIAVEKIKDKNTKDIIQRNSQNLLHLINQMLDLSKLESGSLPLHIVQNDIIIYLKYIVQSFYSLAQQKNINLTFYTELERLDMDYDPDKMQQILSNLIHNALKYTPQYGKILVVAKYVDSNQLRNSSSRQWHWH